MSPDRILIAALIAACAAAQAQEPAARPSLAGRVVRVFDFEEEATNPGEVPQDWFRAQDTPGGRRRPAFPEWNKASLIYGDEFAWRGRGALEMPVRGGCTSLLLAEGVVPVFEDAEYVVSARVRTRNLTRAAARIAARLLDQASKPIPGTESVSEPIRSEHEWVPVSVPLPAGVPGAAFIQVELLTLQPEQLHSGPAEPFHVWAQDFDGIAWFDDVIIAQPPRTEVTTSFSANIIPPDAVPEVRATVRDLTGERLAARLTVFNVLGEEVAREERPMGGAASNAAWKPRLPAYGWYRARLDLFSADQRVGGDSTDLVWLCPLSGSPPESAPGAARTRSPDTARFGVMLGEPRPGAAALAIGAVRQLGVGTAAVPIGDGTLASEVSPLVDSLLADWREATLCVTGVPASIVEAARLADREPWTMLLLDKGAWLPALGDLLDRYGQRVRRWQVGSWKDHEGPAWRPALWSEAAVIRASLASLVAGPVVSVPTPFDVSRPVPRHADGLGVVAVADNAATPRTVESFVSAWRDTLTGGKAPEVTLVLPSAPWDLYGVSAGPVQMVRNVVSFWTSASNADGSLLPGATIAIEEPWRVTGGPHPGLKPRPEFSAYRTAIDMLRGRRAVGKFPVAEGVVCWILAPAPDAPADRRGAMVAWNESASPQDAQVRGFLGPGPIRVVDIDGNAHPAPIDTENSGQRAVRIPLDASPVFIEGIDLEFTRFLAGFRVEPALLESNNKSHPREVVVENPWRQTITGRITILEPGGFDDGRVDRSWRISPRVMKFTVPPGKAERVPFSVAFSPSEEVGPKDFVFDVELTADEIYQPVQVRRQLEVGLADLTLDVSYSTRGERGQDLVIEAAVSNASTRTLTLDLTAFAPDLPRAKTTIVDLVGGNQAVRRMTFAGGAELVRGRKIIVTVRDTSSEARITKSVEVR